MNELTVDIVPTPDQPVVVVANPNGTTTTPNIIKQPTTGDYNPFKTLIMDEIQQIIQRNYDAKYQAYMKEAELRIAHQLALAYFRDANPALGSLLNDLRDRDIVLLDREDKNNVNTMHLIFAKNCLRHLNVLADEFEDIQLSSNQILILSDDINVSEGCIKKISSFVSGGGLVLSYNKAISIVDRSFPGLVKFKHGETTLDKPIEVDIAEGQDKHIFLGLENASHRKKCVRLAGARRVTAVENVSGVEVLVSEQNSAPSPLAIKIRYGEGFVFHILPVGTNEVLELHSRQKVQAYCKQVEGAQNISLQTKSAWKTAFSSGHHDSFYLAISLLPLLDIIFGIIKKFRRT